MSEVAFVARQNPVEPRRKRANQNIRERTFRGFGRTAGGDAALPRAVSFLGVRLSPGFGPGHAEVEQKLILSGLITVEDRREFNVGDGTNGEAIRTFEIQEFGRRHAERRVGFGDINQQTRYPPPRPSLTLSGAEFVHPLGGGATFRPKAPGKTEHRHRARWLPGWSRRAFLSLQPGQQLAGVRLVQLFNLLNDHFDCAHVGSLAPVRTVPNSAFENSAASRPRRDLRPCLRFLERTGVNER